MTRFTIDNPHAKAPCLQQAYDKYYAIENLQMPR